MSRHVMWFLLPKNIQALISDTGSDREHLPIYINPQSIDIKENKLISQSLTKGGYVVQYWGEELPTMSVNGTTGSGGIEAVDILRDIYRYEQLVMKRIIIQRAKNFSDSAQSELENSASSTNVAGIVSAVDALFNDAASNLIEGTRSAIDEITDALLGVSNNPAAQIDLLPSLGAFAVSIDIFFQGVKYRGFFKEFSYSERAESPGLFDYNFTFMITHKTGKRNNFMPWHRNPYSRDGVPRPASIPISGPSTNELSFPTTAEYGNTQEQLISDRKNSIFNNTQEGIIDTNNVGVNRRNIF